MKRVCFLLCMTLSLAAWGCRSKPEVIWAPDAGQQASTPATEADKEREANKLWNSTLVDPAEDRLLRPVVIAAEDAKECPALTLLTLDGEKFNLQPADKDKVTIVVFWFVEMPAARAAARHVKDLRDKYGRLGLRAVGIVERTDHYKDTAAFLKEQKIDYATHYDDFAALPAMGSAAHLSLKREAPCFFIIDKQRRVRVFKRGFSFSAAASVYPRDPEELIIENAAAGQHIEDYVKMLLREK